MFQTTIWIEGLSEMSKARTETVCYINGRPSLYDEVTGTPYQFLAGDVGEPVASYRSCPQQFWYMPEPLLTCRWCCMSK